jgi:hypothetical protein
VCSFAESFLDRELTYLRLAFSDYLGIRVAFLVRPEAHALFVA